MNGSEMVINMLRTDEIQNDPTQPRKYFDEEALRDLTQSIRDHGLLQPVLVRRNDSGPIILVAGERRLRAAKEAGLEQIPAVFTTGNAAELGLVENLLRENLTAIEEAEAMNELIARHACSQDKLSQMLSKSPSTVCEILSLMRLPQDIRDECRTNPKCPRSVLVEVAKKTTENRMRALFESYKKRGLTTQDVRNAVRKKRPKGEIPPLEFIEPISKKLNSLVTEGLEEPDKTALRAGLENLKK